MQPSPFFPNAQDFTITGGNFNNVQGNQNNYANMSATRGSAFTIDSNELISLIRGMGLTTTTVNNIYGNQTNQVTQQELTKERTIFDDFRILKRGDVCRLREVSTVHSLEYELCLQPRLRVTKTISIARVSGVEGNCTVVSYSGPGAHKAFEEDFRRVSSVVCVLRNGGKVVVQALSGTIFRTSATAQVYAVDIGSIPSLICWNELVPAVSLKGNLGVLGELYLYSLRMQLDCNSDELWMDTGRGVICRGPQGPYPNLPGWYVELEYLPSTIDLLEEDVFVRFLASCKSKGVDRDFVEAIGWGSYLTEISGMCHQPTVIKTSTQTPVAVAENIWESRFKSLSERSLLENGLTRFRLNGRQIRLSLELNWYTEECWLSQALSVFHALIIEDNMSDFKLVWHWAYLDGYLSKTEVERRLEQPIYLFIRPPPPNLTAGYTSSLHYWSFERDGQRPISSENCKGLGLPNELGLNDDDYHSRTWPTNVYKWLKQYQLLRAFHPTTTNFAQYLGYDGNIFQPINDANRFEEVYEEQNSRNHSTSAGPLNHATRPAGPSDEGRKKNVVRVGIPERPPKDSFWSSLKRGWLCRTKS